MGTKTVTFTHTALVVDDYSSNRKLFQLALESVGYKMTEAENGMHGINILGRQSFDLLVLDLAMPYIDGVDVLRAIRQQPMHEKMIIVVATANPHMIDAEVEEHVDYILVKPIDIVEFCKFVERLRDNPSTASYTPKL